MNTPLTPWMKTILFECLVLNICLYFMARDGEVWSVTRFARFNEQWFLQEEPQKSGWKRKTRWTLFLLVWGRETSPCSLPVNRRLRDQNLVPRLVREYWIHRQKHNEIDFILFWSREESNSVMHQVMQLAPLNNHHNVIFTVDGVHSKNNNN